MAMDDDCLDFANVQLVEVSAEEVEIPIVCNLPNGLGLGHFQEIGLQNNGEHINHTDAQLPPQDPQSGSAVQFQGWQTSDSNSLNTYTLPPMTRADVIGTVTICSGQQDGAYTQGHNAGRSSPQFITLQPSRRLSIHNAQQQTSVRDSKETGTMQAKSTAIPTHTHFGTVTRIPCSSEDNGSNVHTPTQSMGQHGMVWSGRAPATVTTLQPTPTDPNIHVLTRKGMLTVTVKPQNDPHPITSPSGSVAPEVVTPMYAMSETVPGSSAGKATTPEDRKAAASKSWYDALKRTAAAACSAAGHSTGKVEKVRYRRKIYSEAERVRRRREQNRVAAGKCRIKRLAQNKKTEEDHARLKQINDKCLEEVGQLQHEKKRLELILATFEANCRCGLSCGGSSPGSERVEGNESHKQMQGAPVVD